jgi:hypothetical protein
MIARTLAPARWLCRADQPRDDGRREDAREGLEIDWLGDVVKRALRQGAACDAAVDVAGDDDRDIVPARTPMIRPIRPGDEAAARLSETQW